jgi:hypothetical protein
MTAPIVSTRRELDPFIPPLPCMWVRYGAHTHVHKDLVLAVPCNQRCPIGRMGQQLQLDQHGCVGTAYFPNLTSDIISKFSPSSIIIALTLCKFSVCNSKVAIEGNQKVKKLSNRHLLSVAHQPP